jgi:ATP-dependent RNA helicase RhlE
MRERSNEPRLVQLRTPSPLSQTTFAELGVVESLRRSLHARGYAAPTAIQERAIPPLLAGHDLVGIAQTGTGKTAAFALPILQRLAAGPARGGARAPSALILAPTRELALQIGRAFEVYGRHARIGTSVVFGGVGQAPQVKALRAGIDVLVATPGRLLDLIEQGHARLDAVSMLVLDEADRMLDMGFIRDVRTIVARLPKKRQTMVFSATMPAEIARLVAELLCEPVRVEVTPAGTAVERVEQQVFHVSAPDKRALLLGLLKDPALARVLVFTRTKHGANKVAEHLDRGGIASQAFHGNKSQGARQQALENFRSGRTRVLVATDIAARGLDVAEVSHVINYELPNIAESYVHRIGRTGRAGARGTALSFCDPTERPFLRDIERLTRRPIAVVDGRPFASAPAVVTAAVRRPAPRPPQRPASRRPAA